MKNRASRTKIMKLLILFMLINQLLSQVQLAASKSQVKSLPGFEGPLPFELETGYVGVGELEEVQLFYYFVKSERNSKEDPLILWLTGGPGCSCLTALAYEIGPLSFNVKEYNGSLPTLLPNPHSWTKISNILFVDSPVGTGFSYARERASYDTGDKLQVQQLLQFLRKWLINHQDFLQNPFYIGGDSYSGLIVPEIAYDISNENGAHNKLSINLQGYILGNPLTLPSLEGNMKIPYAHGMGLISDELYASLKRNCRGEYQDIDPGNEKCLKDMQYFQSCVSGLEAANILEHLCVLHSPKPKTVKPHVLKRYLSQELLDPQPPLPTPDCRGYSYLPANSWTNDKIVRSALHIREGSIKEWKRCDYGLPYSYQTNESFQYHVHLSKQGYRALVYSGDHDMLVPFLSTQAWIRSLNYTIVDDWRPWTLKGQVAGYTRTYANQLTFATVKGAGHTAPEYKPAECFAMFQRWISQIPL